LDFKTKEKRYFDQKEAASTQKQLNFCLMTKEERRAVGADFPDGFLLKQEDHR